VTRLASAVLFALAALPTAALFATEYTFYTPYASYLASSRPTAWAVLVSSVAFGAAFGPWVRRAPTRRRRALRALVVLLPVVTIGAVVGILTTARWPRPPEEGLDHMGLGDALILFGLIGALLLTLTFPIAGLILARIRRTSD